MIIGRPDNKIGNASYPIGKLITIVIKVGKLVNNGLVNLSLIKNRLIG